MPNHWRIIHRDYAVVEIVFEAVAHSLNVVTVSLDVPVSPHTAKFGGVVGGEDSIGAHKNSIGVKIERVFLGAVGHQRLVGEVTMLGNFIITRLVGGEGDILGCINNLHIGTP